MATKRKDPKDFEKRGRPSVYTEELADEICNAIASSELGLAQLVKKHPHWPERSTIFDWKRKFPGFSDKYYEAKKHQACVMFEHVQEIIHDEHDKDDVPFLNLKITTIKWQAGRLNKERYDTTQKELIINNDHIKNDCEQRIKDLDKKNKKEY